MYSANVYNVIIVSPSDIISERLTVRQIIYEWNLINSETYKIILQPSGWDINVFPETGDHPQKIINKQILEKADLLIGMFWTRIGTETDGFESGTVEEIMKHIENKKPAMIYFSSAPVILDSVDIDQYNKLKIFKDKIQSLGLLESYNNIEDFTKKISKHLSLMINNNDYFKKENHNTNFSANLSVEDEIQSLLKQLSDDDKLILKEASKDSLGRILKLNYMGGFSLQTNGKSFGSNKNDPKVSAIFEELIDRLEYLNLIQPTGYKRDVFKVTAQGYRLAENIKDSNGT